jgi:hypothetical protein
MCKAYLLPDSEKEYRLTMGDNTATITPNFVPGALIRVKPCRVRVVTNRGVRTISLTRPVAITSAESAELEVARKRAVASCFFWEKLFTPVEKVRWLPDPPFRGDRFVHFWQIVVRGMQPEELIRVEGREGVTLMTARPSAAGVAHMSLMFPGDQAPPELSLELSGRQEESQEAREISVQQVLFEHRASLSVRGPLTEMRFEGDSRRRRLVVVASDQEMVWDVTAPLAPALLRSTARAEPDSQPSIVIQSGKRVSAMATPNLMRALERLQDRLGFAEAVGSPRVGGTRETLYVRTKQGAMLFDISNSEGPREIHLYEQPAWFEGVALGGNLLAEHNAEASTIELYAATVTRTF